jgi:peptidoglycan/LPS O-acetylase OafA/YrhL
MSKTAPKGLTYLSQLDGLRGLAIAGVLVAHLAPNRGPIHTLPWGWLGVRLFFVLSGFLITRILLECRDLAAAGADRGRLLHCFYMRRFLRIFPIYYLTLAAYAAVNWAEARASLPWFALYVSDWLPLCGQAVPEGLGHFWSLAVEEQFYAVWPVLVLFLPRRALLPVIVTAMLSAPPFRLALTVGGAWPLSIRPETPSCLDTLGAGALLACLGEGTRGKNVLLRAFLAAGLPLLVVVKLFGFWNMHPPVGIVLGDVAMALCFTWLVGRASTGFTGLPGRVLEFAPLAYLGKISYGVYVYHMIGPRFIPAAVSALGLSALSSPWVVALLEVCLAVGLASLSWHCLEKPINDLKRRYPYAAPAPAVSPPQVSLASS